MATASVKRSILSGLQKFSYQALPWLFKYRIALSTGLKKTTARTSEFFITGSVNRLSERMVHVIRQKITEVSWRDAIIPMTKLFEQPNVFNEWVTKSFEQFDVSDKWVTKLLNGLMFPTTTGDQALSVRFPVEGHMLHCDLLSSILKYEVSTWLKNKVHQWLLPLTSKCISVFLLECSDFWGSKILGGRGESKGKSEICWRPLTWVWTTFWTVKNLHRSAIHIYIMGPAWNKDSATPLLICAFHKPLNVNVSKHEPFLYRTQNMMNVLVRSLLQKLLHRCHITFFHSIWSVVLVTLRQCWLVSINISKRKWLLVLAGGGMRD